MNIREKCARGKVIVKDIIFELQEHQITGLVGENGAGKSSIMKIMTGLTADYTGEIVFDGTLVKDEQLFAAFIESPKLLAGNTGWQNLQIYRPFYSGAGRERQKWILRAWGLDRDLQKKVKTYSFGMKQKLGLAILFGFESRYYIVDEPTNGLDDEARKVLFRQMEWMRREGYSFLVSSHNLNEIHELCDRIIKIKDGRLENTDYQFRRMLTIKAEPLCRDLLETYFSVQSCENGYARILYEDDTIEQLAKLKKRLPSLEIHAVNHFYREGEDDETDG